MAASCGGEEPSPDPDPSGDAGTAPSASGPPWIAVGTGFPDFEPLEDGQQVPIIRGMQGGYHVYGGFEVSGISPGDVTIDFEILLDGESIAVAAYQDVLQGDGPTYRYAGVAVILYDNVEPDDVSERTVEMTVRVEDRRGVVLEDSITLVPICCEV